MKSFRALIIVVFLILTAVFSAGCTGTENAKTPADNTPQPTQITAEATPVPGETTAPQDKGVLKPGEQVSSTKIFSRNYCWYEYRHNTTSEMPPNGVVQNIVIVKIERKKTEYNGEPAIYMKTTYKPKTYKAEGWTSVYEHYYNTAMTIHLGGKRTEIKEGQLPEIEDLPVKELDEESKPFGEKNFTFVYQGTESITVPAGTFPDAKKYIYYNDKNHNEYTYWFAADVPVPVLVQNPNEYIAGYNGFESDELMGWG